MVFLRTFQLFNVTQTGANKLNAPVSYLELFPQHRTADSQEGRRSRGGRRAKVGLPDQFDRIQSELQIRIHIDPSQSDTTPTPNTARRQRRTGASPAQRQLTPLTCGGGGTFLEEVLVVPLLHQLVPRPLRHPLPLGMEVRGLSGGSLKKKEETKRIRHDSSNQ
ncbi:hypothetical protein BaRGS_00011921 [Batillaria attramentaria]|uniref:Uncharacterized protein n=1 Tax=Batillaria attramentaria TaxID=370345 RepID=A0ABD0LC84_9CAEN